MASLTPILPETVSDTIAEVNFVDVVAASDDDPELEVPEHLRELVEDSVEEVATEEQPLVQSLLC